MLKPIGERVVIKVAVKEAKSAGGLVLPSSAKEDQQIGQVVAVSQAIETPQVQEGDQVIFQPFAGVEVEDGDQKYLVLEIKDIMAIIA